MVGIVEETFKSMGPPKQILGVYFSGKLHWEILHSAMPFHSVINHWELQSA
jgi:hypothetical protein